MWIRLNKLIKPNGAIVLFGSEPFSSALRMSNIKNYKYDWIWEKSKATNFLNAKKQPLRAKENTSVFYQCIHDKVLESITTIRESFVGSEIVFKSGSCYRFYEILKLIHPVTPYYEDGHVVCKLNDHFYDITGEVKGEFVLFDNSFKVDIKTGIIYDDITNNRFNGNIDFVQCPNCDDVFKIA
jgi:hypothetical protein